MLTSMNNRHLHTKLQTKLGPNGNILLHVLSSEYRKTNSMRFRNGDNHNSLVIKMCHVLLIQKIWNGRSFAIVLIKNSVIIDSTRWTVRY